MEIVRIREQLPDDIDRLAPPAAAEGIETIAKLRLEWDLGLGRFDRPAEVLLSVRSHGALIGVGGVTRDVRFAEALRMRRFYVLPDFRGGGAGRLMAEWLLEHARAHTSWMTVHAGSCDAGRFWEGMGFVPVAAETHTHELRF